MLLAQSVREGLIETYEREFAENVLVFGDLRARQVMVPHGDIDYLVLGGTRYDDAAGRRAGLKLDLNFLDRLPVPVPVRLPLRHPFGSRQSGVMWRVPVESSSRLSSLLIPSYTTYIM